MRHGVIPAFILGAVLVLFADDVSLKWLGFAIVALTVLTVEDTWQS